MFVVRCCLKLIVDSLLGWLMTNQIIKKLKIGELFPGKAKFPQSNKLGKLLNFLWTQHALFVCVFPSTFHGSLGLFLRTLPPPTIPKQPRFQPPQPQQQLNWQLAIDTKNSLPHPLNFILHSPASLIDCCEFVCVELFFETVGKATSQDTEQ